MTKEESAIIIEKQKGSCMRSFGEDTVEILCSDCIFCNCRGECSSRHYHIYEYDKGVFHTRLLLLQKIKLQLLLEKSE